MSHALSGGSLDPRKVANMAVTEGVNLKYVEVMRRSLYAAAAELDRLTAALERIAENATSWHGPEPDMGHVRALAVIGTEARAAFEEPLANGGTR